MSRNSDLLDFTLSMVILDQNLRRVSEGRYYGARKVSSLGARCQGCRRQPELYLLSVKEQGHFGRRRFCQSCLNSRFSKHSAVSIAPRALDEGMKIPNRISRNQCEACGRRPEAYLRRVQFTRGFSKLLCDGCVETSL